jgi:hypothetical protein
MCNNLILRPQCVKDLGDLLDCKLCIYHHIDCIFPQGLTFLCLIRYIATCFSTPHCLCILHTSLVRPKLEYASVAWSTITFTDSLHLKRVQIKCALCRSRFLWTYVAMCMRPF